MSKPDRTTAESVHEASHAVSSTSDDDRGIAARIGIWFAAASFCLALGALILFGITLAGDGAGPGGAPIFFSAMSLIGLAPLAGLIGVLTALNWSAVAAASRLWRVVLVVVAVVVYLWWFLVASSQVRVPEAAIFVPAPLPGAAAVIATPGARKLGALVFLVCSLAVLVASWIVFSLPGAVD